MVFYNFQGVFICLIIHISPYIRHNTYHLISNTAIHTYSDIKDITKEGKKSLKVIMMALFKAVLLPIFLFSPLISTINHIPGNINYPQLCITYPHC